MKPDKPTYPCDANRLRGHQTRLLAVEIVAAYRERKRRIIAGRDQVTPPLLTSEERGLSNSINARLHRIIGKYRDST